MTPKLVIIAALVFGAVILIFAGASPRAQVQVFDVGCAVGTPFNQLVTRNPVTGNQKAFGCIDSAGNLFLQGKRIVSTGTPLSTSNFLLGAGWGSTASISSGPAGTDQNFTLTITSGGVGQTNSATLQLTFADGPGPNFIRYVCTGTDNSTGGQFGMNVTSATPTQTILTYANNAGVVVSGHPYVIGCIGFP